VSAVHEGCEQRNASKGISAQGRLKPNLHQPTSQQIGECTAHKLLAERLQNQEDHLRGVKLAVSLRFTKRATLIASFSPNHCWKPSK
jgi:hypothetical protein